jgi:CheY-like chemotaxis protein
LPLRANGETDPRGVPEAGSSETSDGSHTALRVLFVEDHESTREALTRILKRRGYHVRAASTVQEARGAAFQEEFDVLVSDLGLPDGNGSDLMVELRSKYPSLLGIAISGFGMNADLTRSRAAGFNEHLTKPVSIDSLDRALTRILKR